MNKKIIIGMVLILVTIGMFSGCVEKKSYLKTLSNEYVMKNCDTFSSAGWNGYWINEQNVQWIDDEFRIIEEGSPWYLNDGYCLTLLYGHTFYDIKFNYETSKIYLDRGKRLMKLGGNEP